MNDREREYHRRYYARNRDRLRANSRRWYAAHREQVRAKQLIWQRENRDEINARSRAKRANLSASDLQIRRAYDAARKREERARRNRND